MTTNFIPNVGDRYCFVSRLRVYTFKWGEDSTDREVARGTGIFPFTPDGRELADWQLAIRKETPKFWEWVDDY